MCWMEGCWEVCGENRKLEDVEGIQEVGDKVEIRTTNQCESKGVYTGNMRTELQSNITAGQHEGEGSI